MPAKHDWTEVEDAILREMEASGRSTDDMARAIGVGRTTVRHRCIRMGIGRRFSGVGPKAKEAVYISPPQMREQNVNHDRDPLPAGHALTWGAIVAGTCIEGQEFR